MREAESGESGARKIQSIWRSCKRCMPKMDLEFEAVKFKCQEDEDGEIKVIFRVSKQDKLSAIAIPVKKSLHLAIKILKEKTYGEERTTGRGRRKTKQKKHSRLTTVREACEPGING